MFSRYVKIRSWGYNSAGRKIFWVVTFFRTFKVHAKITSNWASELLNWLSSHSILWCSQDNWKTEAEVLILLEEKSSVPSFSTEFTTKRWWMMYVQITSASSVHSFRKLFKNYDYMSHSILLMFPRNKEDRTLSFKTAGRKTFWVFHFYRAYNKTMMNDSMFT